jgi:CTP synthase
MTKYIFVAGGVLSGLGKGIVTASIGKVLQSHGYSVTAVKIDPYINFDAGTLRPTEHGEVWVTEDGGEIDQDFGHYERFLGIDIQKQNNITTGQVYWQVIENERRGKYLGKTVEVMPHIPLEIIRRIDEVGEKYKADIVLVEIGGTVGDYQNVLFLEAGRMLKQMKPKDVLFVLVSYLPIPRHIGEMKTKPTQQAVALLREIGIQPDFVVCRSEKPVDDVRKQKIVMFCGVEEQDVIADPDVETVYEIPILFEQQKIGEKILAKFGLENRGEDLRNWTQLVANLKNATKSVKIGLVGKYVATGEFSLADSYISINEALTHACASIGVKPELLWVDSNKIETEGVEQLKDLDGIVVPGGFGKSGVEGKIAAIKFARENNVPFLGLCFGLQLAVVEYARHICNMQLAHSTEIDETTNYPVICILPEQQKILDENKYGATMRLGSWPAVLSEDSLVKKIYGSKEITERHRHRYEVNPIFINDLERSGLIFSGQSPDRKLMEFLELPNHKFFVATQAHPEFKSRFEHPSPLFVGFVQACISKE